MKCLPLLEEKKEHIHFAEGSISGNGFSMLHISLCASWILIDIFVVTWGFPNGGCANICSASFSPRVSGKSSWEISGNQVKKFIWLRFHKFCASKSVEDACSHWEYILCEGMLVSTWTHSNNEHKLSAAEKNGLGLFLALSYLCSWEVQRIQSIHR